MLLLLFPYQVISGSTSRGVLEEGVAGGRRWPVASSTSTSVVVVVGTVASICTSVAVATSDHSSIGTSVFLFFSGTRRNDGIDTRDESDDGPEQAAEVDNEEEPVPELEPFRYDDDD